jgi:hypothetical protein
MCGWGEKHSDNLSRGEQLQWGIMVLQSTERLIQRSHMATREPRYSREEFARRGQEIYDQVIRPSLRSGDEDKFVAIDIESASYEMDRDDYAAVDRLLKRLPDAQIWLMRVGQKAAYRIGGRL